MMNANRIRDIDFWRGAVLIVILIDHSPGNPLENLTPRNFGLSDSAEAFIFLSGLSIGLIYMPRARKYGLEPVAGGLLRRALKLYGVHIALTLAALLVFGAAYWISGVSDLIEAHGRSFVFGSPSSPSSTPASAPLIVNDWLANLRYANFNSNSSSGRKT